MAAVLSSSPKIRLSSRWTIWLFVAALGTHFALATHNFTYGFMIGHEFRQAQTAIIAEYIDKQDNFGLYYETPILGKPWAFPLEFPLYEWAVVVVKRALGLELFEAGRAVSLASFYASLGAFWIILGAIGQSAARRWIILAVTMLCPVLIFYSRAVLIDPMAMCFSAWFLASFLRMMQTRKLGWLAATVIFGTTGILVKNLVFAVWLFPAALYGAWALYRAWREHGVTREVGSTIAWGVGSIIIPMLSLWWWIRFTDGIKEGHRSGYIFTSKNLSVGNFGTFSLDSRLSLETWKVMALRWSEALMSPWALWLGLVAGVLLCRSRRDRFMVLLAAAIWMFGQLAFPYAYAYQDYYFYAGAALFTFAFGLAMVGLLEDGRGPLALRVGLALVPVVAMGEAYFGQYFKMQAVKSQGGDNMAFVLRDMLPEDSVIMALGHDWSAILPYYAKRRAIMVRSGLEEDPAYLDGAIDDLDGDQVGALVVTAHTRVLVDTVRHLCQRLKLVNEPLFSYRDSDVYVSRSLFSNMLKRLHGNPYGEVVLNERLLPLLTDHIESMDLPLGISDMMFPAVLPGVERFHISFGYSNYSIADREVLSIHPESDLWLRVHGPAEGSATLEYGLADSAWDREGTEVEKTDGVEFALWAESEANPAERRELWSRKLAPVHVEADRGLIKSIVPIALKAGERLVLTTRPGPTKSYDWAYLAGAEIELPESAPQ